MRKGKYINIPETPEDIAFLTQDKKPLSADELPDWYLQDKEYCETYNIYHIGGIDLSSIEDREDEFWYEDFEDELKELPACMIYDGVDCNCYIFYYLEEKSMIFSGKEK